MSPQARQYPGFDLYFMTGGNMVQTRVAKIGTFPASQTEIPYTIPQTIAGDVFPLCSYLATRPITRGLPASLSMVELPGIQAVLLLEPTLPIPKSLATVLLLVLQEISLILYPRATKPLALLSLLLLPFLLLLLLLLRPNLPATLILQMTTLSPINLPKHKTARILQDSSSDSTEESPSDLSGSSERNSSSSLHHFISGSESSQNDTQSKAPATLHPLTASLFALGGSTLVGLLAL